MIWRAAAGLWLTVAVVVGVWAVASTEGAVHGSVSPAGLCVHCFRPEPVGGDG